MDRAGLGEVTLAYEEAGAGEPVVFIHGAFIADAFRPLLAETELTTRHRLVTYHRRGYGKSSRTAGPTSFGEQADDCRRLIAHLGLRRAHVVGHSFGGAIALQLALEAPERVHTLALLEPGLMVGESAELYKQGLSRSLQRYQEAGARVAVDEFLRVRCPAYRERLDWVLPGAFEQAVVDAAACFEADLPVGLDSHFEEPDARRIACPVLVVLGEKSVALHPRFAETYRLLLEWLPNAEGWVLSDAAHFLQVEKPQGMAEALRRFYERHPLAQLA